MGAHTPDQKENESFLFVKNFKNPTELQENVRFLESCLRDCAQIQKEQEKLLEYLQTKVESLTELLLQMRAVAREIKKEKELLAHKIDLLERELSDERARRKKCEKKREEEGKLLVDVWYELGKQETGEDFQRRLHQNYPNIFKEIMQRKQKRGQ